MSSIGVRTPEIFPNMLPNPNVINIQKNSTDQTCGAGIFVIASVNAINDNPVPEAT